MSQQQLPAGVAKSPMAVDFREKNAVRELNKEDQTIGGLTATMKVKNATVCQELVGVAKARTIHIRIWGGPGRDCLDQRNVIEFFRCREGIEALECRRAHDIARTLLLIEKARRPQRTRRH